jgi:X-X-X-Leu-X-X-Gly heptad repeat protein
VTPTPVPPTSQDAQVSANVPLVLGLHLTNQLAVLPPIVPGVPGQYDTTLTATVTSTGGTAALSVADVGNGSGKLANGSTELASPLMIRAARGTTPGGVFAPLTGTSNPLTLLTYSTWISNDPVTISIRQPISSNEPLTAGSYSKVITFTLSGTTP